jgi:hypothetical protein
MHMMQQVNGRIVELESKVEKLELQAARMTLQNEAGVKALLNKGPSNPEQQV